MHPYRKDTENRTSPFVGDKEDVNEAADDEREKHTAAHESVAPQGKPRQDGNADEERNREEHEMLRPALLIV